MIVAVPTVREGVFFTTPAELPRGRHYLERADIVTAQRERLMIAVTELMAESGYRGVSVQDASMRAKVSKAAFYECFDDKDACVYAAYDRFIAVLLTRVRGALPDEIHEWTSTDTAAVIKEYLATLDADPVTARAFQVEMDALGRPARKRRRDALVGMAQVLKTERDRLSDRDHEVPVSAYVGAVYAMRQLASDVLDERGGAQVSELAAECAEWIESMLTAHLG
ncbi:hypothetical protein ASG84_11505 [Rhodococcus sp. Leaf278]|nr:hypothetical protein ASG84_11505 [Rhodococcus sp. Leaf278]